MKSLVNRPPSLARLTRLEGRPALGATNHYLAERQRARRCAPVVPLAPGSVSGLTCWLDGAYGISDPSDLEAVPGWADKSGNGLDVSQATGAAMPIYHTTGGPNGLPFVEFDGVDDCLEGADTAALNAPTTVLRVATWLGTYVPLDIAGDNLGNNESMFFGASAMYHQQYGQWYNRAHQTAAGIGWGWDAGYWGAGAASDLRYWLRGEESTMGLAANGSPGPFNSTTRRLRLGGRSDGTLYWSGRFAEVLIYNRALTDAELLGLGLWLAAKYNLT